jgi:serine/threonine protein kinase
MRLSAGTRLGSYEILAPLGAGGMGEVYRARDSKLDRLVAIKLLADGVGGDACATLLREARAAAALNHPNICTIYEIADTGAGSGQPTFIVMEHVDGQPLSALVESGIATGTIVRYGTQIAEALGHAHERGIVHRDLKSANLMVTQDGRVKVLDFGIATLTGDVATLAATRVATAPGTLAGTPAYMAPEVLKGGTADRRSDIWAIGVVLYEMAARRRPFGGDTAFDISAAILRDEPEALPRDVPRALRVVVARCLAKDPAERYQQAGEIRAALEATTTRTVRAITEPAKAPQERTQRRPPSRRGSKGRIRSLAVLPLDNLSRDPEQEYFVDGMTEELISAVARIEGLRVISRMSIMRFKRTTKPAAEIARELNVDAIVAGSVRRAGDRVRIFVQLIDPANDSYVWTSNFDNDLRDIQTLESTIAEGVAGQISLTIASTQRPDGAKRVDPDAYTEYLKGRQHWHRGAEPDIRKALDHLQNALAREPLYAPAHAGVALCHMFLGWLGAALPHQAFPLAKAAATRALELDGRLAEAYSALGYVAAFYEWDWDAAARALRRAIELQPNSADAHIFYAWLLNATGRHHDADVSARRALTLDPLSPLVIGNVAYLAIFARRFDVAEQYSRMALDLDPATIMNRWGLGIALLEQGRLDESIAELTACERAWPGVPIRGWLGYACAVANDRAGAEERLDSLEKTPPGQIARSTEIARILVGLGEHDRALAALADACRGHEPALSYVASDPCWDRLQDDERFKTILRTIGVDRVPRPVS